MKTIKDALQASSIEQRRRILNNIDIDKDSKNFIVSGKASQANGGGSEIKHHYYKLTIPTTEPSFNQSFEALLLATGSFKISTNDGYIFCTYEKFMFGDDNASSLENMVAFEFTPVTEGAIYTEFRVAKDLKDFRYLYSLRDSVLASKMDFIIDNVVEITEDEYYNTNIN